MKSNPTAKIIIEESFSALGGTLRLDLVVTDGGKVHVLDVMVRYEDQGYLQHGHHDKITKYSPLLAHLAERYEVAPGMVLPIVVGTKGAMLKSTISSLMALDIVDKHTYITISLMALRNSLETSCILGL
jgi:hypothetical protein